MKESTDGAEEPGPSQSAYGTQRRADPLSTLVPQHLVAVVSISFVGLALLKMSRVAHTDISTVLGLLQCANTTQTLLGVAAQLMPYVLVLAFALAFLTAWRSGSIHGANEFVLTATGLLMIFFVPWQVLLTALGILIVDIAINWSADRRYRRTGVDTRADRQSVYLTLFLVAFLAPDTMWMPVEQVRTPDNEVVVGYVLRSGEGETVILTESDRRLVVIDGRVSERKICLLASREGRFSYSSNLMQAMFEEEIPDYPDCEELD